MYYISVHDRREKGKRFENAPGRTRYDIIAEVDGPVVGDLRAFASTRTESKMATAQCLCGTESSLSEPTTSIRDYII